MSLRVRVRELRWISAMAQQLLPGGSRLRLRGVGTCERAVRAGGTGLRRGAAGHGMGHAVAGVKDHRVLTKGI
jgi:hypothetical protein